MRKQFSVLILLIVCICISCRKNSSPGIQVSKSFPSWPDTSGTKLFLIASNVVANTFAGAEQITTNWSTFIIDVGRVVRRIDSSSDGYTKKQERAYNYNYDAQGRITRVDGADSYSYAYDNFGKLTIIDRGVYKDYYAYNSAGQIIIDSAKHPDSTLNLIKYYYDTKGNIDKRESQAYYSSGMPWGPKYIYLYTYDNQKNPWLTISAPAVPDTPFPVITPNNVVSIISVDSLGNVLGKQKYIYTYNSHGLPTSVGDSLYIATGSVGFFRYK